MKEYLYSNKSNLVIGFHGCDQSVVDKVVTGKEPLYYSKNNYDWLGHGIYFWENNVDRALEWAIQLSKYKKTSVIHPAVIGAVIDLGYCFDLMDNHFLNELKEGYKTLVKLCDLYHIALPENSKVKGSDDLLLRKLDCAVIQTIHNIHKETKSKLYDSVRGVFWEGRSVYPNAGFREKNHIQLCICNPNCIKGYFLPRKINKHYTNP